MIDEPGPHRPTILGAQNAPPVTGAPLLSGAYGDAEPLEAPAVPERPSSKLPFVAALIGALVLLGGGGFFALTAFAASGGAETPEAAVDALLEAAGNEDFITIAELIDPAERRTIVEPMVTEVMPELVRLGMFERSPNPSKVEGLDIEFTDVTYRVESPPGSPDIVFVYFTGGEVATKFDASELPFTDAFRDEFGDEIDAPEESTEDLDDGITPMVLVERNGRWYVSGWFTVADNLRRWGDEELPTTAEMPLALGSPSPEAAVENMIQEMVTLDIAGVIGRTDPDEMAALYRYSPLFLDEAAEWTDEVLAEAANEGVAWSVTDLELEAEKDGDDAAVLLRAFTIDVSAPDYEFDLDYGPTLIAGRYVGGFDDADITWDIRPERWKIQGHDGNNPVNIDVTIDGSSVTGSADVDGESATFTAEIDPEGQCSTVTIVTDGETETVECLEDDLGGQLDWYASSFEQWSKEFPGIPFAAHRTDGEWYVSPIGTMFDVYINALGRMEDGAFRDIDSAGEQMYAMTPFSPWAFYWLWYGIGYNSYDDDYYDTVEEAYDAEYVDSYDEPAFEDAVTDDALMVEENPFESEEYAEYLEAQDAQEALEAAQREAEAAATEAAVAEIEAAIAEDELAN